MGDDEKDDPDRAAILARRQRFIAIALSGFAVACGKDSTPQPCLDIGPSETTSNDDGATSTSTATTSASTSTSTGSSTSGMPMPCLDVAPTTSTDSGSTSGSSSETGGTTGADTTGSTGG